MVETLNEVEEQRILSFLEPCASGWCIESAMNVDLTGKIREYDVYLWPGLLFLRVESIDAWLSRR